MELYKRWISKYSKQGEIVFSSSVEDSKQSLGPILAALLRLALVGLRM